jgi:hypothetical protein
LVCILGLADDVSKKQVLIAQGEKLTDIPGLNKAFNSSDSSIPRSCSMLLLPWSLLSLVESSEVLESNELCRLVSTRSASVG